MTSNPDYCNSAIISLPAEQTGRLQKVQNSAAQLVLQKLLKRDHVTPLLNGLYCLPVKFCCEYKVPTFSFVLYISNITQFSILRWEAFENS